MPGPAVGFGFSVGAGDGVAADASGVAVAVAVAMAAVAEPVAFALSGFSARDPQAMTKTMSASPSEWMRMD